MKLWLDADREPEVTWVWAKTAHCAIVLLKGGCVERISFPPDQHDTVAEVLDWMIRNDSPAKTGMHKPGDGVRYPRGLLRIKLPGWAAAL